jgi:hypothetical protein
MPRHRHGSPFGPRWPGAQNGPARHDSIGPVDGGGEGQARVSELIGVGSGSHGSREADREGGEGRFTHITKRMGAAGGWALTALLATLHWRLCS